MQWKVWNMARKFQFIVEPLLLDPLNKEQPLWKDTCDVSTHPILWERTTSLQRLDPMKVSFNQRFVHGSWWLCTSQVYSFCETSDTFSQQLIYTVRIHNAFFYIWRTDNLPKKDIPTFPFGGRLFLQSCIPYQSKVVSLAGLESKWYWLQNDSDHL